MARVSSRAYVTFLAGTGDYVNGVVGLAKGMKKAKSIYRLVVAVMRDVPEVHRKLLLKQGCIVREIEPVCLPENQIQIGMAQYVINYSKLRIWEFVEYSKMIYLDGDIQLSENIDPLFDMQDENFYAVMGETNRTGYCQQGPQGVIWPKEMGPQPTLFFEAGMFIFEPSLSIFQDLLSKLKITSPIPFAERDFLNMYFRDIYKPIPPVYNPILAMLWKKNKTRHVALAILKPDL